MGKAKPYSITPEGERYLETAKQKTLTLGADGGLGWAARGRDPELHQAIVDLLVRNSLLGKENEPSLHRLASDIIDVVERNNKRQR